MLDEVTWEQLASIPALGAFLMVVVAVARSWGLAGKRATLGLAYGAGQVFAQVAFGVTRGLTVRGVADAFLVGFCAACIAVGLHQAYKAVKKG